MKAERFGRILIALQFSEKQILKPPQSFRMATNLGKRKRGSPEPAKSRKDNGDLPESVEPDAQEIFRRHFEARFKPLPVVKKPVKVVEETPEDGSEAESEWDGISDNGETSVQVIEHTDKEAQIAMMSKEQLKEFMVRLLPK